MSDVRLNVFWRLLQSCLSGPVAQLVEQRIENPRVGSSILPQATILKRYILKTLFAVCNDRLPKFTTINSGIYGIDNWEWRDKSLDLRQI
jgi:hypothetical protein